jgi:toxin-antitoxin system PIN domain toxin
MTLVDANVLIYAYNPAAPQHPSARAWLEQTLAAGAPVRLAWVTVLAFVRIMTHAQVFRLPLTLEEAVAIVDDWLAHPAVAILEPGERHWPILRGFLLGGQAAGPLATDAFLAALAVEHGARLCTTDRDFARFEGLTLIDPTRPAA